MAVEELPDHVARIDVLAAARLLDLQEAENAGAAPSGGDVGRAHVVLDDATTIEFFHDDITDPHDFIVTGYWGDTGIQIVSWEEIEPN